MRRLLSKLFRNEQGVALPTVIGALTITTGLAAGTFAVTIQGSAASQRDRDVKSALGAAEAGLQMASLTITQLQPKSTQCVTTELVGPQGTECPSTGKIAMGNGATYEYVVSLPGANLQCATVPGNTPSTTLDRCITAIGEVNGVKRRLQMRFAYQAPFAPWGNAGLVGRDRIDIGNNKTINSTVGTNGHVNLENNATIVGSLLLPDGNPSGDPNATTSFGNHAGATLGRVDTPKWTFPEIPWEPTPRGDNDNHLLQGIPGWNPLTKVLTLSNHQVINLPNPVGQNVIDLHLCRFDASGSNGFSFNIPNGKITRLWIDSNRGATPAASGWCGNVATNDGTFIVKNDGHINATDDKNPAELEVYMYGSSADSLDDPDLDFQNNVEFYGSIWAPNSTIDIWNNQGVSGAISAKNVVMKNNGGFVHDNRVRDKTLPGTASAKNLSWFECRKAPTVANDPESGCS